MAATSEKALEPIARERNSRPTEPSSAAIQASSRWFLPPQNHQRRHEDE